MKLLIAVDSALSTEGLVRAVMMQPWPDGTTVNVLSVVVDAEVRSSEFPDPMRNNPSEGEQRGGTTLIHERGIPEEIVEQEVRRLLRFVDLEDAIDMMPAQLSGGMRVRVGIARALAGKPRTLLMDEPTGGLDPPTAWSVCELGIRLRDLRDVSAILVTHAIEYVRFIASTYAGYGPNGEVTLIEENDRLCLINTKIMMLREGRIIFNGSDEELFISEDKNIREFLLL